MDQQRLEGIKHALADRDSDELRRMIWENDREVWTEEAFSAAQALLEERNEPVPQPRGRPPDRPPRPKRRKGLIVASVLFGFVFHFLVYVMFFHPNGLEEPPGWPVVVLGAVAFYTGWEKVTAWWRRLW